MKSLTRKLFSFWVSLLCLIVSSCLGTGGKKAEVNSACRSVYEEFYRQDRVQITVVFGYKDAKPARFVGDRYEKNYFIQKLIGMGFFRTKSQDDELFQFDLFGLDGKIKKILLRVVASSVGPDDFENRTNPFQKWQSDHSNSVFTAALKSSDVVFYNGHSRSGGGPDFEPPHVRLDSHIDYAWYKRHKPGLKNLIGNLKSDRSSSPSPLKLLGLFSCTSDRHFSSQILAENSKMGLVSSRVRFYFADTLADSLEVIEALTHLKCRSELRLRGTEIKGFFTPRKIST